MSVLTRTEVSHVKLYSNANAQARGLRHAQCYVVGPTIFAARK